MMLQVSDVDNIDRLISCLHMALPLFMRGASNSKFLNYLNKHIIPVLDELPEERKLDLLKNLAESSPYTTPQDSRQLLPSVVQLLKKYMPRRKAGEEMNLSWKEAVKPATPSTAAVAPGGKRTATTAAHGANNGANKKGRGEGGVRNQLMNRALEGLSRGGRGARGRGWGTGRGRGRGFRNF